MQLHRRTDRLPPLHEESDSVNSTMTPAELATLADDIEARAWVDYYDAAPPALRDALGIAHDRVADATVLLAPGVELALFNRAIGLGLRTPANEDSVAQVAAAFTAAGSRQWWLHVNAHAQPRDTALSLEAAGWWPAESANWVKMLRPAGVVDAGVVDAGKTTLRVAASTDADADAIVDAITRGFGLPPFFATWLCALHGRPRWQLYGVFDGATAVGGGALFLDGDRAWVGIGSMLESHRRRGGQRAVMARRINDATRAGVRWIATETGEPTNDVNPSLLNMQRCGFECVATRRNLLPPLAIRSSPGTTA